MNEVEKITAELVQRHFDLPAENDTAFSLEQIRAALIEKLNFLLDHDFEKLLWILYRIDVSEQKAKAALAEKSDQPPAEVLADLIIQRQLQKAETRLKYRSGMKENDDDSFPEH